MNDTIYPSLNLFLQSNEADVVTSESNVTWYLQEKISIPIGTRCLLSVIDFECPYSFYNINEKNNVLVVGTSASTQTITLESKNYDIDNLVSLLNLTFKGLETALGTLITVTFDFSKNKLRFTSDTLDFTFLHNTTIDFELGLGSLPRTSNNLILDSADCINLAGTPYLQINTNLGVKNVNTKSTAYGVLARIPIRCSPTDYIFHQATENQYFMTDDNHIDKITISLSDFKGNELVMNGAIFSLTLGLHFQYQRIPKNVNPFKLSDAYKEIFKQGNNKITK